MNYTQHDKGDDVNSKKLKFGMILALVLAAVLSACASGGAASGAAPGTGSSGGGDFLSGLSWDAEYDVVVIGFGGAGATAAISAADAGARVLLLEKAPYGEEGGNTKYAGQLVLTPTDRAKTLEYYRAIRGGFDNQSDEVVNFIVDGLMANRDWLIRLGADANTLGAVNSVEFPEYAPRDLNLPLLIVNRQMFTGTFWKLLHKNVMDRSDRIDVWYSSPAVQLIQDRETKIIHGVTVSNNGRTYQVRAINGVVMALGGFENNDEMLENFAQLPNAYSKAARYNTGDGVKMAIDIGADLWHMSTLAGPDVNFINPDTNLAQGYYFTIPGAAIHATGFTAHNAIVVGGNGRRFMSETDTPRHGHVNVGGTFFSMLVPQNSWCVFDETARNITPAYPSWSPGMTEEIAKGWIVKADSIRELAAKTGIDPDGLEKTIAAYNRYCAEGNDPDFEVAPQFLKPIVAGPFYAFPVKATLTNTQGGAKRNVQCEVLDVWGRPIPHLYSAGEFGSFYTDIYNGGGNLGECGFSGRRAGENAARPKNDVSRASVLVGTPVDLRTQPKVYSAGPNEYIGTGSGIGGDLVVKVTLDSARKISDISFLQIFETRGVSDRAIILVPQAIIRTQSTQVDTVTGATVTSRAIIDAVNDALSKAR
jgi:succinate dehydrogenase/fumarate reductase flavoprotein subunit/uncharacterized protein with FMN-binding domain